MTAYSPGVISNAVLTLCSEIQSKPCDSVVPDERQLWLELSTCILSSQVPYELAAAAANAIDTEQVLLSHTYDFDTQASRLYDILSTPFTIKGRSRKYRFPAIRAKHLAAAHKTVLSRNSSLRSLIDDFHDACDARTWLVKHVSGVGPKQASMFLRNAGVSYDLAILDRHVLNYMSIIGIYSGRNFPISDLNQYRKHEDVLRKHAQSLSWPVGIFDFAIWIVMRIANRNAEVTT